jgi:succinate-semialdehyde dehydrogenase/glutarate-semialdehyde dehydrogenase
MTHFKSINPYSGKVVGDYPGHSKVEVQQILLDSQRSFENWRTVSLKERAQLMSEAGNVLLANEKSYADMITLEMGKPVSESRAEIKKCAWVCNYYSEHADMFLAEETIETEAAKSFVRNDPIGCVLAIMPWNFPFWQVFRYAAPTLTAGNTALLKHATNVLGCATLIADVFQKAGFPTSVFQNLMIDRQDIESVIGSEVVKAVTLTGSERAGSAVAAIAGKHLKKTVLELGGSNAFIVLGDANIEEAVKIGVQSRMLNGGQSCIAAKRFILLEDVYDKFISKFTEAVKKIKSGDPLDPSTQLGPLARIDLADQLQRQIQESLGQGAVLLCGGKQNGCYHEPTILGNVRPGMPAFEEETFGPLAAMIRARDEAEALSLSERSPYGLGVTICTTNTLNAVALAERVSDGACFINELVKSDPRLPFGGTKRSGYGRELSRDGILEFVNRKTVYVK